jgi:hypothetical protein
LVFLRVCREAFLATPKRVYGQQYEQAKHRKQNIIEIASERGQADSPNHHEQYRRETAQSRYDRPDKADPKE